MPEQIRIVYLIEQCTLAARAESYMRFWQGLCRTDLAREHHKKAHKSLTNAAMICDDNHRRLFDAIDAHILRLNGGLN